MVVAVVMVAVVAVISNIMSEKLDVVDCNAQEVYSCCEAGSFGASIFPFFGAKTSLVSA